MAYLELVPYDADLDSLEPLAILDSAPDGMVVIDVDGTILLVNRQAESMFARSRTELIGRAIEVLVPETMRSDHRRKREHYSRHPRARNMSSDLELYGLRGNGTLFPVDVALSPVALADRTVIIATVRDMSERVEAEAHSHAVLHTIDAAQDAVMMFRPHDLRFTYVNRGARQQLGYTQDELMGMVASDIAPEFSVETYAAMIAPLIAGAVDSHQYTTIHRHRSGHHFPVEVTLEYPPAVKQTGTRFLVAFVRDMTAHDRLRADRDHINRWLEALGDIRAQLLADTPLVATLTTVCDHARELVGGERATIAVPDSRSKTMRPLASSGTPPMSAPIDPLYRPVLTGLGPMVEDTTLIVPIGNNDQVEATLTVDEAADIDAHSRAVATSLATEAGTAFDLDNARQAREHLRVAEDRERLARDLHDLIIQRVFAAGLRLQSIQGMIDNPDLADRVADTITQLDETIAELRAAIFRLSQPEPMSLQRRVEKRVARIGDQLGFTPDLVIKGDLDTVPVRVAEQVDPALAEALANVTRHADATHVVVELVVENAAVTMRVSDDGVGFDPESATGGQGLQNLHNRARELGGATTVLSNSDRGTVVTWTVSLEPIWG